MNRSRPYINLRISELRELSEAAGNAPQKLSDFLYELDFRSTKSAFQLKQQIEAAIHDFENRCLSVSLPTKSSLSSPAKEIAMNEIQNPRVLDEWDPKQRIVFEGDEETCLLVEAGPGSGKTAVACKRVAWLVEECDVEASKILLVSFTRTAVRELQNRIESHAAVPLNVAGVRIVTLDSFTWQIVSGLGDMESDKKFESYNNNIVAFTDLLKNKDKAVLEFLGELEHVIVDEAQDLVGARADLVIELVRSLPEDCGVTVFGDSAQAIYGFTDDSESIAKQPSATTMERIVNGELPGFEEINLENNHRTSDVKLRELCSEGRKKLLRLKEGTADSWKAMRSLIKEKSHGAANDGNKSELQGRSDTLVLYRSRAEAILFSSFLWADGIEHKLRMSGVPVRIHPWIGRVFGDFVKDTVRKAEFMALWASRVCTDGSGADAAWELLKRFAWEHGGIVRLAKLRSVLGRSRPPLDFLVDERDLPGPIVGTIHASKGREAAEVRLMLPSENFVNRAMGAAVLAEEERVLFVGATRARARLLVGQGMSTYAKKSPNGRVFRSANKDINKGKRQVEIGLKGDVSVAGTVSGPFSQTEAQQLQDWFWENQSAMVRLELRYEHENGGSFLYDVTAETAVRIGRMSTAFNYDLFAISREIDCNRPGATIRNLRMVGVTTAVIGEPDRDAAYSPWKQSAFVLLPVITGFPMVFFNK
jgi:hypothetical protein